MWKREEDADDEVLCVRCAQPKRLHNYGRYAGRTCRWPIDGPYVANRWSQPAPPPASEQPADFLPGLQRHRLRAPE